MCDYNIAIDNNIAGRVRAGFDAHKHLQPISMDEYNECIPITEAFMNLRKEIHQKYQSRT